MITKKEELKILRDRYEICEEDIILIALNAMGLNRAC